MAQMPLTLIQSELEGLDAFRHLEKHEFGEAESCCSCRLQYFVWLSAKFALHSVLHKVSLKCAGYRHIQGTKPQTLGCALNDSPAGLT